MNRVLKIAIVAASVAAIMVALIPDAEAQCSPARTFASRLVSGMDNEGERIDGAGSNLDNGVSGSTIGLLYCSQDMGVFNNFNGQCPPSIWLQQTGGGPCSSPRTCVSGAIGGDVGTGVCLGQGSCPIGLPGGDCDLTMVVQDQTPAGDAVVACWRVDSTPAASDAYDFRRVRAGANVIPMQPFPKAELTRSDRIEGGPNDGDVDSDLAYVDVAVNFEGAGPAAGDPCSCIAGYDLLQATGMADPGRDRGSYTQIDQINCQPGGVAVPNFTIPCDNTTDDTWLAVGLRFGDDAGGSEPSAIVGEPTRVECDPFLADPGQPRQLNDRSNRGTTELQQRGQRGKRR